MEPEYDGVRFEKEMTQEFIDDMIKRFKDGKKLHRKYAYQVVMQAKEVFAAEPTMPEVTIAEGKKLTVCGDTHGEISQSWMRGEEADSSRPILRSARDLQPQRISFRHARLPL